MILFLIAGLDNLIAKLSNACNTILIVLLGDRFSSNMFRLDGKLRRFLTLK
jgi:hypothetical protein